MHVNAHVVCILDWSDVISVISAANLKFILVQFQFRMKTCGVDLL